MERGSVVKNINTGEYYIFLKFKEDGQCKVAKVEELLDEYETIFHTKITQLLDIDFSLIEIAPTYPNYFNNINIA